MAAGEDQDNDARSGVYEGEDTQHVPVEHSKFRRPLFATRPHHRTRLAHCTGRVGRLRAGLSARDGATEAVAALDRVHDRLRAVRALAHDKTRGSRV